MATPTIGVLALQGDVAEHLRALERGGAKAQRVRRPEELAAVDAAILRTLARIKRKDPAIYQDGKDVFEGMSSLFASQSMQTEYCRGV